MIHPAPVPDQKMDAGHGVSCAWLHHQTILHFTLTHVHRDAIDTWMNHIQQRVDAMPLDQPVLLLHQLPEMPVTPYFRQRSEAIVEAYRHQRRGRTAVLLPRTAFDAIMRNFAERDLAKVSQSFERRVFNDYQTAVDWLLQALPD